MEYNILEMIAKALQLNLNEKLGLKGIVIPHFVVLNKKPAIFKEYTVELYYKYKRTTSILKSSKVMRSDDTEAINKYLTDLFKEILDNLESIKNKVKKENE